MLESLSKASKLFKSWEFRGGTTLYQTAKDLSVEVVVFELGLEEKM